MRKLLILLLLSFPLAAEPVITRLSATSGPIAGGNEVRIEGEGSAICVICSPPLPLPLVLFGGAPAVITAGDKNTLIVTVPAHPPGTFDVVIEQSNGTFVAENAYTYIGGEVDDAFERVLLPLLTSPVHGAFGSEFHTALRLANTNDTWVSVFGVEPTCPTISGCIVFDPLERPYVLSPHTAPRDFTLSGKPGRFLYIDKKLSENVFANLRVFDVTRSAFNFGTEIPVVPISEFTLRPIKLLGVPGDSRFRNTLRIYAEAETSVTVVIDDMAWHVPLRAGENVFDPAYAQFTDFPTGIASFDVTIVPSTITPPMPGLNAPRVWAFISVTNNDTQLITTITPQ